MRFPPDANPSSCCCTMEARDWCQFRAPGKSHRRGRSRPCGGVVLAPEVELVGRDAEHILSSGRLQVRPFSVAPVQRPIQRQHGTRRRTGNLGGRARFGDPCGCRLEVIVRHWAALHERGQFGAPKARPPVWTNPTVSLAPASKHFSAMPMALINRQRDRDALPAPRLCHRQRGEHPSLTYPLWHSPDHVPIRSSMCLAGWSTSD